MLVSRNTFVLAVVVGALTSGQAQAALQKPVTHKVKDKSDAFKKNYRGKTGGLDIFKARAVLNADGSTDLYVSVGYDPNYLPPGPEQYPYLPTIKKVQFKFYEENGHFLRTENEQIGTPAKIFHRTDLKRHQRIVAEATVDNVILADGISTSPRTYVMTDTAIVSRRPDLAIVNIGAAPTETAGTTTTVVISVKELGGDLPADALCQADLALPQANAAIGSSYPTAISVGPGETVDCILPVTWNVQGSWSWHARARLTQLNDYLFYGDRNPTNNDVTVPVTIQGPHIVQRQGFALANAFAYDFQNAGTFSSSEDQIIQYPYPPYYVEWANTVNSGGDSRSLSIGVTGQTAGSHIPYPMNIAYTEYGASGNLVTTTAGASSGPTSFDSYDSWLYDPILDIYNLVHETLASDFLFDDATSTYVYVQDRRTDNVYTGEVIASYTTVGAGRNFGHEASFSVVTAAYRNDPSVPLDFVTIQDSSYYVQFGPTPPAPLTGSYRVTLAVTDGAGAHYSADALLSLSTQIYSGSNDSCFSQSYLSEDGVYAEYHSCTASFGTSVSTIGSAGF